MNIMRNEECGMRNETLKSLTPHLAPRTPHSQKGVTLVEMMIVVALSSIIVGGMSVLMVTYSRAEKLTRARINAQQNVRIYLDLMMKLLREAQASTVVVDQATSAPPWSRITFTNIESQSVCFYQSGSKLYSTIGGTTKMLATNLRSLKFTYPMTTDDAIIGVSLCFEEVVYGTQTNVLHLSVEKVRLLN